MPKILIIDDEAAVRTTLRLMLEAGGHTVVEASNGRQGVELYLNEMFDLVLTDIIMPEQEGIETIIKLRRHNKSVRIIAASGGGRTNNFDFLKIAAAAGADRILQKPLRKAALLAAVEECLA